MKLEVLAPRGEMGIGPIDPKPAPGLHKREARYREGRCPPEIGILVGETVYNLRAALDYLVYELAILDSGHVQEKTQFPIESCESEWESNQDRRLAGLNPTHKALIKCLQPYRECDWTGVLRDISNPDKHRTLTLVNPVKTATFPPMMKSDTTHVLTTESMGMDVEVTF